MILECKCPHCRQEDALFGRASWIQGRIPVSYIKVDEDDPYTIQGILEDGRFLVFDPGSRFECIECGEEWDTVDSLVSDIVRMELESTHEQPETK